MRYVEIIQDIRRAFFSGLSRCQNAKNPSPHMTTSGGSSNDAPSVITYNQVT